MKVRELLTDESKWTQGCQARDKDGNGVFYHIEKAVSYCLMGAIFKCYAGLPNELIEVQKKIHDRLKRVDIVAKWNDAPERKFEEVRALIEEMDI